MSRERKKMVGKRFNRLKVEKEVSPKAFPCGKLVRQFECICDCGNVKVIPISSLNSGGTQSCGCLQKERVIENRTIHGRATKKEIKGEYHSWCSMKSRCDNPKAISYHKYGGRGISYCKRWAVFENFYEDMGKKPKGMSLDRIDNNKNYSPENCRWATPIQQANNTRGTRRFDFKGSKMTLRQISEIVDIPRKTLENRLYSGWSLERAVSTQVRKVNRKK